MRQLVMRPRRRLAAAMSAWLLVTWSVSPGLAAQDELERAVQFAQDLSHSLMLIEDGENEAARDRWDPQWVVENVGTDPETLFAWMQENVAVVNVDVHDKAPQACSTCGGFHHGLTPRSAATTAAAL